MYKRRFSDVVRLRPRGLLPLIFVATLSCLSLAAHAHPLSHSYRSPAVCPQGGGSTPTPTPTTAPSQTGWRIEIQGKGTNSSSHHEGIVNIDGSTPWNWLRWTESGEFEASPSAGAYAPAPAHETANASTGGSFKIVCTWQGNPAQEPDFLTLVATTSSYIYIPHGNSGTVVPPHMSVSASDGWGDTFTPDLHSKT